MSEQVEKCAICGEGYLTEKVSANIITYKGISFFVDSHYSVCDKCESSQASAEQSRINKQIAADFKRSVDGRA